MAPHSRAGVTFMEVVIALVLIALVLIAFVAAVLFPVFQKVDDHPHHGNCASNMTQLGLAMTQYEQDADGNFPSGATPVGNGWAGQIYPFVKAMGVYHCPNDPQEVPHVSHTENLNLVRHSLDDLTAPAATVELYEFTTLGFDPSTAESVSATGLVAPQDSKRHDGSTFSSTCSLKCLAADGHVKYFKPGQVSGGPDALRAKMLPQRAYVGTFAVK